MDGWEHKALGEVIQLEYGKPLLPEDRHPTGLYPAYGANGEKDRTNKFYCDRPSIVVGRKGSAGEITLTEDKFWPLDVTYFVDFDRRGHDLRFLYYLLATLDLPRLAKGVKPGINRNEVYALPVRVPPLLEQRRLVAILDEASEAIATTKSNTEKNLQNAREVFDAFTASIFQRGGANWRQGSLLSFAEAISTGPFGSLLHKSDYVSTGVPLVNPINIVDGLIVPDPSKLVDAATRQRLQSYVLRAGDIVVGRRGEIGRCAVVGPNEEGWVCGTGCFFIRPRSTVRSDFIAHLIRSPEHRARLERASTGATMKNLSNTALGELQVAVPNLSEQDQLLALIGRLSEECGRIESMSEQKLAAFDELKKSLLHQAFTGQLTAKSTDHKLEVVA